MTILLDPPKPDSPSFEVDHQIAVALAALRNTFIMIRGAGRLEDHGAGVLLDRNEDAGIALAAPNSVGIRATIMEAQASAISSFVANRETTSCGTPARSHS